MSRAFLTACLGYVLAFQLIVAGLGAGAQAARSLDPLAFNPHVLCLTELTDGGPGQDGPAPAHPHRHDLCCPLAGGGVAPFAPPTFIAIVYAPAALAAVLTSADLGALPAAAPPGRGRGPRAPPSDLA